MADMLTEYKPNRPLRSLGSSQLEIPRVHTKQGESAFSYFIVVIIIIFNDYFTSFALPKV